VALAQTWDSFFKPETRKSGQDLFVKDVVSISNGSDTYIQAYVRGTTTFKVTLSTPSISEETFTANCTCTTAQRDQLCKHIWAALLKVADKFPDFLEAKKTIEKAKPQARADSSPPSSTGSSTRAQEMKEKQAEYRKAQYQKQKDRLKEQKTSAKRSAAPTKSYPEDVENAFKYFSQNGFELKESLNEEDLSNARKKLSRVFHPDKGGTHDEALTLNENFSILEALLNS
jgi:hypothetical protein